MAPAGRRCVAPRVVALLLGVTALLAAGTAVAAAGRPVTGVAAPAVRTLTVVVPDDDALPPAAADRLVEAIGDHPAPLRTPLTEALLVAVAAALALAAAGTAAREDRRPARAGHAIGPGSTRAPPVTT